MEIVHKKNTAYYLAIPMIDSTIPASFKTGLAVVDIAYSKDADGAWTALAITDTFAEIGNTGIYEINLSATEMNHDQVLIKLTSAGAADSMVLFKMEENTNDDLATDIQANESAVSKISVKGNVLN